ncbi:MAG: hypothetical protein ABIQ11_03900, partial [Saprospiraceae bacterium]
MPYNPTIHHRRSIRLKGYDYSQPGRYFVTVCIQNRTCLLGKITDGQMIMNDAGTMIEKWYFELENKFPDIKCDTHVIMPNHFHCIIENLGANRPIPVEQTGRGKPMCLPLPNDADDVGEHFGDVGEHFGDVGEHFGMG